MDRQRAQLGLPFLLDPRCDPNSLCPAEFRLQERYHRGMMRGLSAPSLVCSSNFPEVMITTAANTATESSLLQQAAACADALLRTRNGRPSAIAESLVVRGI